MHLSHGLLTTYTTYMLIFSLVHGAVPAAGAYTLHNNNIIMYDSGACNIDYIINTLSAPNVEHPQVKWSNVNRHVLSGAVPG